MLQIGGARAGLGLVLGREIGRVYHLEPGRSQQAAGAADHQQALDAGPLGRADDRIGRNAGEMRGTEHRIVPCDCLRQRGSVMRVHWHAPVAPVLLRGKSRGKSISQAIDSLLTAHRDRNTGSSCSS